MTDRSKPLSLMIWLAAASAICLFGCAHHPVHLAGNRTLPADNSYLDLEPGHSLRIVLPVTASGTYTVATQQVASSGNSLTVRGSSDLIGYDTVHYALERRLGGKVRLRFAGAASTRDGKTIATKKAPPLPFALPTASAYVRLIFLTRSSQSDHNMAIAASRMREDLLSFTAKLKMDPAVCSISPEIFCAWVPPGVAVRPD